MSVRERLSEIVGISKPKDYLSRAYDYLIIAAVVLSIINFPLIMSRSTILIASKEYIIISEICITIVLLIDYILRWVTADFRLKKGRKSFLVYPATPMAIIDLLSLIPGFVLISEIAISAQIIVLIQVLRILRIVRLFRHSRALIEISRVIHNKRKSLFYVAIFILVYIIFISIFLFCVEEKNFGDNFFTSLYYSILTVTGLGAENMYPSSLPGMFVVILTSFVNVLVFALPIGILTSAFVGDYSKKEESGMKMETNQKGTSVEVNVDDSNQENALRFCSYCGTNLESDANYCRICGRKVIHSTEKIQTPDDNEY